MDEQNVVKEEVKATPAVEPTPPEPTTEATTEKGTVEKETQPESQERLDKHPRFQEVIKQKNDYKAKYDELLAQQVQPEAKVDPYANYSPEEKAIREYEDLKSDVKRMRASQEHQLINNQITEAKSFAEKVGMNFDEKLPEIVPFLSRPENKGRLTAKEAFINLYANDIFSSSKDKGKVEAQTEARELMEKKKQASMQASTVNQNVVQHTDELSRKNMSREEKLMADVKWGMEQAKQGIRNTNVRVD